MDPGDKTQTEHWTVGAGHKDYQRAGRIFPVGTGKRELGLFKLEEGRL